MIWVVIAWLAAPMLTLAVTNSLLSGVAIPTQASLALTTILGVMVVSAPLGWLVGRRATRAASSSVLSEEGVSLVTSPAPLIGGSGLVLAW